MTSEESSFREQMEIAKRQMREASPEVMREYLAEVALFDGMLADGLEEFPWQE